MVHEVGPPPDPPDRAQLCSDLHGVGHVVEEDEEEIKRNIWRIVRLTHIGLLLLVPDDSKIRDALRKQSLTLTRLKFQQCLQEKLTLDEEAPGPL